MKGWVYIIINDAMPDLVKVGYTMKDPDIRAKDLNTTGSAAEYRVAYELLVESPKKVEEYSHELLSEYHENKEWFRVKPSIASVKIKEAAKGHMVYLEHIRMSEWFETSSLDFGNGWTYEGPVLNSKANGIGILKYKDGIQEIAGEFIDGNISEGRKKYLNTNEYKGPLVGFRAEGQGVLIIKSMSPNQDHYYYGEFKDDQPNGQGSVSNIEHYNMKLYGRSVSTYIDIKNPVAWEGTYINGLI